MNAKYYIYWNLHHKCYSVKYRGKVIKHFHNAVVAVPEFRVSAAGRERKKAVHAYIVSNYVHVGPFSARQTARIAKYNPYVNESFVDNDGKALYNAHEARLRIFNGKPVIEII